MMNITLFIVIVYLLLLYVSQVVKSSSSSYLSPLNNPANGIEIEFTEDSRGINGLSISLKII